MELVLSTSEAWEKGKLFRDHGHGYRVKNTSNQASGPKRQPTLTRSCPGGET